MNDLLHDLGTDEEDGAFYDAAGTEEEVGTEGVAESYLERARRSAVPLKHLMALSAAAQLDDEAAPGVRIGYGEFFEATCRYGARHWLDPMPALAEINETLRRYLAPREALGPVVEVLTRAARARVSPFAMLDYVVVPRLREDRNWRRWGKAHMPVIRAATNLVERLRAAAPYDAPVVGVKDVEAGTRRRDGRSAGGTPGGAVLTDVFLVKYVAVACIGRTPDELNEGALEKIEEAWRGLRLRSRGFVLFLRLNVRPFLARLGARLEISRYLEILDVLPEIEARIEEREAWRSGRRVVEAALYGSDPGAELVRRETHGYKAIHFLREFRDAIQIYRVLLRRTGGAAAVGRIIARVRSAADPGLTGDLAELVERLQDTGGRHIYAWHAVRLGHGTEEERARFIREVVAGGGAHPDYPRYAELFRYDEFRHGRVSLTRLAAALGLPEVQYESPRGVFRAYLAIHPEAEPIVERFKTDVAVGADRRWSAADRAEIDALGGATLSPNDPRREQLHALLLYGTIRGLSGQYTRGVISTSLEDLWSTFPTEPFPSVFDYRDAFTRAELSDRESRERAAGEQLSLSATAAAWGRIAEATGDGALSPEEAIAGRYRILADSLASVREEKGPDHKATRRVARQVETVAAVQDALPTLAPVGRMCVTVLLAGYFGRKADELRASALRAVFDWTVGDEAERERLDFLTEDIDAEAITLTQAEYLVSFLTDTAETIAASGEVNAWVEEPAGTQREQTPLAKTLAELALTKQKRLTAEALDAAFRAIVNLSTLAKEVSRGREVVDAARATGSGAGKEKGVAERYYELFVSRTPLDAYYGDMGATCLSRSPGHVTNKGFLNIRLTDRRRNEIVGMAAMQYVPRSIESVGVDEFWFAFAFNPVRAVTNGLGVSQLLNLYLRYRGAVAHVAKATQRSVFIPGVAVYGVVSNDTTFGDVILEYEKRRGGRFVVDARGFSLHYPQDAFAHALMIKL